MTKSHPRPRVRARLLIVALAFASGGLAFALPSADGADIFRKTADFGPKVESGNGYIEAITPGIGGKFYIVGRFSSVGDSPFANIARFNGDGTVDDQFTPELAEELTILVLHELNDGTIMVGGVSRDSSYVNPTGFVHHLDSNGGLLRQFGGMTGFDDRVVSIDEMPDGRILVGGMFNQYQGNSVPKTIILNRNGTRDESFAPQFTNNSFVEVLATLAGTGGKVYIGGSFSMGSQKGLVRLNANGTLDETFRFESIESSPRVWKMLRQPDGRLVLAGWFQFPDDPIRRQFGRIDATGAKDESFNIGAGPNHDVLDIQFGENGSIWAAGDFTYVNEEHTGGAVLFQADGTLDLNFDIIGGPDFSHICPLPDGSVAVSEANLVQRLNPSGMVYDAFEREARGGGSPQVLVPVSDGKWIVAGDVISVDGIDRANLARLNADGTLDDSFKSSTAFGNDILVCLELPDGRLLVGGDFRFVSPGTDKLTLLDEFGGLDTSFVQGTGFDRTVKALALQADGKVLVGGSFLEYNGNFTPRIARLNTDGTLDTSFDPGTGPSGDVEEFLVQDDGKILVRGFFWEFNGETHKYVVRLNADGSIDTTFNTGAGFSGAVMAMTTDDQGRLYFGGDFETIDSVQRPYISRLMASGAVDSSFDPALPDRLRIELMRFDGNGDLWATTRSGPDPTNPMPLLRVFADGTYDAEFSWVGTLGYDRVKEMVAGIDGAIVLTGHWGVSDELLAAGVVKMEKAPVPTIDLQPANVRIAPGDPVSFAVQASGPGLAFQWFKNGVAIDGAISDTFGIASAGPNDVGEYWVTVTNEFTTVESDHAFLSGTASAPVISSQPETIEAKTGDNASLSVAATGSGTLLYEWKHFGQTVKISSDPQLNLSPVQLSNAGLYQVVVWNGLTPTVSEAGWVVVKPRISPNRFQVNETFAPRFEVDGGSVYKVAPETGGGFYAAGDFLSSVGNHYSFHLVRFLSDGSVDQTFSAAPIQDGRILDLEVQSDGKLLIGGTFTRVAGKALGGIARLNADGTLDETFSLESGTRTNTDASGTVLAIALQADGKIVLGGEFATCNGSQANNIVRLNSNGKVDASFATGLGFSNTVYTVAIDPDGSILAAGPFSTYNEEPTGGQLVRLNTFGELDHSLNGSNGFDGPLRTLEVQANRKILVGGEFTKFHGVDTFGFTRLEPNGSRDATLNPELGAGSTVSRMQLNSSGEILIVGNLKSTSPNEDPEIVVMDSTGEVLVQIEHSAAPSVYSAALLASGKIAVGGGFDSPSASLALFDETGIRIDSFVPEFRQPSRVFQIEPAPADGWYVAGVFDYVNGVEFPKLARLTSSGGLDLGFAPDTSDFIGISALARLPDGSLLVSATWTPQSGPNRSSLFRMFPDGSVDRNFTTDVSGVVLAIAPMAGGETLVAGNFDSINGLLRKCVARLRPDGSVDPNFVPPEDISWSASGYPDVLAVAVHPDGRVMIGGQFERIDDIARPRLARLSAGGALDHSFDASAEITTLTPDWVRSIVWNPNGTVDAGGRFGIKRFLPSGQTDPVFGLGTLNIGGDVNSIVAIEGAELLAGLSPFSNVDSTYVTRIAADSNPFPGFEKPLLWSDSPAEVLQIRLLDDGSLMTAGSWMKVGNTVSGGMAMLVSDPWVSSQESDVFVGAGQAATLTAHIQSMQPASIQWYHNGTAIPGATQSSYTIPSAQSFLAGDYTIRATVLSQTFVSGPIHLAVQAVAPSPDARVLSLSTRGLSLIEDQVLIPGFVIQGTGTKRLLIRAIGPTLGTNPFSISGTLENPSMVLKKYNSISENYDTIANNDDWETNANTAEIIDVSAQLFAFGLNDTRESVLLVDLGPGQYTVVAAGVDNGTGISIVELYDADSSPSARLTSISNRGFVGIGDEVMIPGFVISEEGPKTVLIRVVGPTLAETPFGVSGAMQNPHLTLFRRETNGTETMLLSNDNWQDSPDAAYTASTAEQLYAFPLGNGSADAAVVVTLNPGVYSVVGSAADGLSSGVVLVEVYIVE